MCLVVHNLKHREGNRIKNEGGSLLTKPDELPIRESPHLIGQIRRSGQIVKKKKKNHKK